MDYRKNNKRFYNDGDSESEYSNKKQDSRQFNFEGWENVLDDIDSSEIESGLPNDSLFFPPSSPQHSKFSSKKRASPDVNLHDDPEDDGYYNTDYNDEIFSLKSSPPKNIKKEKDTHDEIKEIRQNFIRLNEERLKSSCKNMNDPISGKSLIGKPVFVLSDINGVEYCFNLEDLFFKLQSMSRTSSRYQLNSTLPQLELYISGSSVVFNWDNVKDSIIDKYNAIFGKAEIVSKKTLKRNFEDYHLNTHDDAEKCTNGSLINFRDPITDRLNQNKQGIILISQQNHLNYCFDKDTLINHLQDLDLYSMPLNEISINIQGIKHQFKIPFEIQRLIQNVDQIGGGLFYN